jgi:hypothetical protein
VFLELLDEQGNACALGETGRVIVTALHNYASPVVRYELGEVASWQPECVCGHAHPVLTNIGVGRLERSTGKMPSPERLRPDASPRRGGADLNVARLPQPGDIVTTRRLKAGWAYAELGSSRFGRGVSEHGEAMVRLYDEMAQAGVPLSSLVDADLDLLVRLIEVRRSKLMPAFAPLTHFRCEAWSRDRLLNVWTMWGMGPAKDRPIRFSEFLSLAPGHGPDGRPDPTDPRTAAEGIDEQFFRQEEPGIVLTIEGRDHLIEGYLRGLLFVKAATADARFLVWKPVHNPAQGAGLS